VKNSKKIVGKPIRVGERTLIPTIEVSTFSRHIRVGKGIGEMVITGVMVTPVSLRVIEGEKEWTLEI
jgi:uncharacterized spore protein YtfJ